MLIITITKFSNLIGLAVLILALIGQCGTRHICNWTLRAIARALKWFFSLLAKKTHSEFLVF